jgi:hypothetical protein
MLSFGALKDITQSNILAIVAALGGLLVAYGLITNSVEQHYMGLASIFVPLAYTVGKSLINWKHLNAAAALAVITVIIGGIVQANFIDAAHGKAIVGLASVVLPVAFILGHTIGGFFSAAVPSRGPYGPPINTPVV